MNVVQKLLHDFFLCFEGRILKNKNKMHFSQILVFKILDFRFEKRGNNNEKMNYKSSHKIINNNKKTQNKIELF